MMHALIPALLLLMPQEPDTAQLVRKAKLTMGQAVERAMQAARTGVVVQAELEFEQDRTVWSLDVAQGKKILEVLLDAKDGKVIETGEEDEDQSEVVQAAKLTLKDAVAAVVKQHAGTPVLAQLRMVEGKPAVTVEVFAAGKLSTFVADVATPAKGAQGREEEAEDQGGEHAAKPTTPPARPDGFTRDFGEDDCDLGPTGRNPYFVLEPGYTLVLEGMEGKAAVRIVITVTHETKTIAGIHARVVEEREFKDGQIAEITRDYFAISTRTNNVYYLGEDVDVYEDGAVKNHEGAWLHGQDGAHYGLMMPGTPLLGARFQQEMAPGVAMDRAEIDKIGGVFECPAGRFEDVLRVKESTPLEQGSERKVYARGVGLLQDGDCKLVRYGREQAK